MREEQREEKKEELCQSVIESYSFQKCTQLESNLKIQVERPKKRPVMMVFVIELKRVHTIGKSMQIHC